MNLKYCFVVKVLPMTVFFKFEKGSFIKGNLFQSSYYFAKVVQLEKGGC